MQNHVNGTQLQLEFPQEPRWVQLELPFPNEISSRSYRSSNQALLYVIARKIAAYETELSKIKDRSAPIDTVRIEHYERVIREMKERVSSLELERLKSQNKNDSSYLKSNV